MKTERQSAFECIICIETAQEPVVVKCGHLFCWPCIYEWTNNKAGIASCPVCKNPIKNIKNDLIPIFTKEENVKNTDRFRDIPKRPLGERNSDERNTSGMNFEGGFGFFPFCVNSSHSDSSPFGFLEQFSNIPFKQSIINIFILVLVLCYFSHWE